MDGTGMTIDSSRSSGL